MSKSCLSAWGMHFACNGLTLLSMRRGRVNCRRSYRVASEYSDLLAWAMLQDLEGKSAAGEIVRKNLIEQVSDVTLHQLSIALSQRSKRRNEARSVALLAFYALSLNNNSTKIFSLLFDSKLVSKGKKKNALGTISVILSMTSRIFIRGYSATTPGNMYLFCPASTIDHIAHIAYSSTPIWSSLSRNREDKNISNHTTLRISFSHSSTDNHCTLNDACDCLLWVLLRILTSFLADIWPTLKRLISHHSHFSDQTIAMTPYSRLVPCNLTYAHLTDNIALLHWATFS